MAGETTQSTTAGLDAELTENRDGTWEIALRDDQGTEVYRKAGYANQRSAKAGAYYWARKNYDMEAEEQRAPRKKPKRASPHTRKAPTAAHLSRLLLLRADRNEEKAIGLRTEADALETEAKRLRGAADALGGS